MEITLSTCIELDSQNIVYLSWATEMPFVPYQDTVIWLDDNCHGVVQQQPEWDCHRKRLVIYVKMSASSEPPTDRSYNLDELQLHKADLVEALLARGWLADELFGTTTMTQELAEKVKRWRIQTRAALRSIKTSEANLPVHARNALNKVGIKTIGDLLEHTAEDLLKLKGFGVAALVYVRRYLRDNGVSLRGTEER